MKELYKIIKIKTIGNLVTKDLSGQLSFFESDKDIPFNIKRIYYITKVQANSKRGYHAHKKLKQLLFCPYGKIELYLEDDCDSQKVLLDDPSIGILLDHTVWREMRWIEDNSVLMVAASDYYDENDYIRDYDDFRKYIGK